MKKFTAAIDGLGTMNLGVEGWAYFVLEAGKATEFDRDARSILETTSLKAFHGKEYARRFHEAYRNLFQTMRDYVESPEENLLATILLSASLSLEYRRFCEKVVVGAMALNEASDEVVEKAIGHLVPPMFSLARWTSDFAAESEVGILFDSHPTTQSVLSRVFKVGDRELFGELPLRLAYNAYRSAKFASAPQLAPGSIQVIRDEESMLLQAADTFGNFSTAFAQCRLGKRSKTIEKKAELFESIFGSLLADADLAGIRLSGEDLLIDEGGVLNLVIRNTIEQGA
jgi:hypothetical protein